MPADNIHISYQSGGSLPLLCTLLLLLSLNSCSLLCSSPEAAESVSREVSEKESPLGIVPPSIPALASGRERAPTPIEAQEKLRKAGKQWLYGNGFGKTMLNVGTVVIFPPYALYLLGNAGLALAGFEPLSISEALPKRERGYVENAYNSVTSLPGRLSAVIAGETYLGK